MTRWTDFVREWSAANGYTYMCAIGKPELSAAYRARYPPQPRQRRAAQPRQPRQGAAAPRQRRPTPKSSNKNPKPPKTTPAPIVLPFTDTPILLPATSSSSSSNAMALRCEKCGSRNMDDKTCLNCKQTNTLQDFAKIAKENDIKERKILDERYANFRKFLTGRMAEIKRKTPSPSFKEQFNMNDGNMMESTETPILEQQEAVTRPVLQFFNFDKWKPKRVSFNAPEPSMRELQRTAKPIRGPPLCDPKPPRKPNNFPCRYYNTVFEDENEFKAYRQFRRANKTERRKSRENQLWGDFNYFADEVPPLPEVQPDWGNYFPEPRPRPYGKRPKITPTRTKLRSFNFG